MSMQFDEAMDEKSKAAIMKAFGDTMAVSDEKTALFDNLTEEKQEEFEAFPYEIDQNVTTKIHKGGDVVEMSDGTKYQVTTKGWRKIYEVSRL